MCEDRLRSITGASVDEHQRTTQETGNPRSLCPPTPPWVWKMTTMQKLLQLPVNAVNIVKTVQSQVQGQEEAKSPVLTPDSGQQTWYNALPDELRHLRSPSGTGGGGGGDQEERATLEEGGGGGGGSFQTQPLR